MRFYRISTNLTFNIKVVAMVVVGGRVGAAAHQKAALR